MLVFILHAAFRCNCLQYLVASDNAQWRFTNKGANKERGKKYYKPEEGINEMR